MIESISVRWKWFVNVYIEGGKIFKVEFSKKPAKEFCKSSLSEMLREDLTDYFRGSRVDFRGYEISLNTKKFTTRVLNFVREIPYGNSLTYKEVAKSLKTSPRAVGRALKLNPVPIILPCHRVLSERGLGGFSYGLDVKLELLKLERINFLF